MPIPNAQLIMLVDDNVQSGNSLVALDLLLGASHSTSAFAVAITDSRACSDALKFRQFTVSYDEARAPLEIDCAIEPVR